MTTRDDTLRRLQAVLERPASARELIQRLAIPKNERLAFRRHLKALAATGALVHVRGQHYALPDRQDEAVGELRMSASGSGFVVPEGIDPVSGDVYIGPDALGGGMHGDRVVARIDRVRD